MGREGSRDREFFVQTMSENLGAHSFENYYTNIRIKKKMLIEFEKKIQELGHCEESVLLSQHCEAIQKEIDILMDLFRGRMTERKKKIIYIPMDVNHVVDYLGFLINEGIDKHLDTIKNLMNALDYETGVTKEDKNQMSYYERLINHFKTRVDDDVKKP